MKNIIKRIWVVPIIISIIGAGYVYVYDPIASPSGWPSGLYGGFSDIGLFKINPDSILETLYGGSSDVFLPNPRSLDDILEGPILYSGPFRWGQADYLKIAQALNDYVWKDKMEEWNLFYMTFNSGCQNNLDGLTGGVFKYFKTTFNKGRIAYTWRTIVIDPEYEYVAWGGDADFAHPILGLKSIDLSKLTITAEDALTIAEENGGRDARLQIQNQCNIHLLLMPERYNGWRINYGYSSGFEIQVDEYTGEVVK